MAFFGLLALFFWNPVRDAFLQEKRLLCSVSILCFWVEGVKKRGTGQCEGRQILMVRLHCAEWSSQHERRHDVYGGGSERRRISIYQNRHVYRVVSVTFDIYIVLILITQMI